MTALPRTHGLAAPLALLVALLVAVVAGEVTEKPPLHKPAPADNAEGGGVLTYRQVNPDELNRLFEYGGYSAKLVEPLTEEQEPKALPRFVGTPVYFSLQFGGPDNEAYLAVFDPKANKGQGLFYFDSDRDGDLAEEEPLASPAGQSGQSLFGPIEVLLQRDGAWAPYHFWFGAAGRTVVVGIWPFRRPELQVSHWYLHAGGCNFGEVTFFGRTYRAATYDNWTDGCFNSICWSCERQGDLIAVDFNDNGRFERDECLLVGERGRHDGRWYTKTVSTDGTKVTFGPLEVPFGSLVSDCERFFVQISSRTNLGAIPLEGKAGRFDVPADTYSLYQCWGEETDEDGSVWRFQARYDGPYPKFEVVEGELSDFRFGSPFVLTVTAAPDGPYRPGQSVWLAAELTGAGGKFYTIRRDAAPVSIRVKLTVEDSAAEELASFEVALGQGYVTGPGTAPSVELVIPTDARGDIVVKPSTDLGPFGVNAKELVLKVE